MAKIGIECEGRLCGVLTLFMDAAEAMSDAGLKHFKETGVQHVYISDHDNVLNYTEVAERYPCLITLDVTKVHLNAPRLERVGIMLTLPTSYWESVNVLRSNDQVKFHSGDQHVFCATRRNFVRTFPYEFENDKELPNG